MRSIKIIMGLFLTSLLISCTSAVLFDLPNYSANTKLYLPANGTVGTLTFPDLSPDNRVITNYGSASIQNANNSWRFNNAGFVGGNATSLLSTPSLNLSTNVMEISFWMNSSGSTGNTCIVGSRNTSTRNAGEFCIGILSNNAWADFNDASGEKSITTTVSLVDSKWHFIKVQRVNTTGVNLYVDGVYRGGVLIAATDKIGSLVRNVSIGQNVVDNKFYTGYFDEVVILNGTFTTGTDVPTAEFVGLPPAPVVPINASFTQSPNPSNPGQAVTFTDTSLGTPVTWNWTLSGSSPTNTTQNAAYTYTAVGAYTIFLNVTNSTGSWSNTSQIHNVVNATGLAPQDIWMQAQYLQTFHITDSATGLPIPVVQIQDSAMQTFATTNGTGYLTEPFGTSTVTFVSTGYTSRAISYVFDSAASHEVQLTASSTSQQNVWYTPWQVRIRIVDFYGAPLPGTNVTASYIAQTLPSTDTSWLVSAFGISSQVASDMVNSAKAMEGVTDDNGGLSFTMFKSLEYHLVIANATNGVASTKNLYPSDQEYVIYVRTAGQTAVNNTLATRNATLPWYSLNSTYISLNMTYQDPSSCTSAITFRVWFRDNSTEVHNATQAVGTALVTDSHIIPKAPIGTEYLWGYNATTVC